METKAVFFMQMKEIEPDLYLRRCGGELELEKSIEKNLTFSEETNTLTIAR